MKQTLLLTLFFVAALFSSAQKKVGPLTAYAITGVQKGQSDWTEVRLVDLATGTELQTVYASASQPEILNARTGKAVAKKDNAAQRISTYQPFATSSAACAYDEKNQRLYYTPMGIAQLRYIDLKAKSPRVCYFEDEAFGVVKGKSDVASHITRMVIAGDGNGYALSNDGKHLLQFSRKKKPVITDLGALTNDATNGRYSVHSPGSYGGDMVADNDHNLWLITAGRTVYKIDLRTKVASYVGSIKGLPAGYSTNGAVAEGDSKVVVSSSGTTAGYYRFDLNTLQAEKISGENPVYNASDLASATLAFSKKSQEPPAAPAPVTAEADRRTTVSQSPNTLPGTVAVFPNPVRDGFFRLSFANSRPGRYQIQLLDDAGRLVSVRQANVQNNLQVETFRLPTKVAAGNYLVRISSEDGLYTDTRKIMVQ